MTVGHQCRTGGQAGRGNGAVLNGRHVHLVDPGFLDDERHVFGSDVAHGARPVLEVVDLIVGAGDGDFDSYVEGRPGLTAEGEQVTRLEHAARPRSGRGDEQVHVATSVGQ